MFKRDGKRRGYVLAKNLRIINSSSKCIRCGNRITPSRLFETKRPFYCSFQCNLSDLWFGYLFVGFFGFLWSDASFKRIISYSSLDFVEVCEGVFHFGLNIISLLLLVWGSLGALSVILYQIYNQFTQANPRDQRRFGFKMELSPSLSFIQGFKQLVIILFIFIFYFIIDWTFLSVITRDILIIFLPEAISLPGPIPTFLLEIFPFPFIEASANTPGFHIASFNLDYWFFKGVSFLMVPAVFFPFILFSNARTVCKAINMIAVFLLTAILNIFRLVVQFSLIANAGTDTATAFYYLHDAPSTFILCIFLFLMTIFIEILGIPLLDSLAEIFIIPRQIIDKLTTGAT